VGAKFHLGLLRGRRQDPDLREPLEQIDGLLDQSLETSRNLTVDLSPPILTHGNMAQVLGWLAIRERLDWLNGSFEVNSAPGRGTCATLTIPIVLPGVVGKAPLDASHASPK
jgi:signal transduction histidine kinase